MLRYAVFAAALFALPAMAADTSAPADDDAPTMEAPEAAPPDTEAPDTDAPAAEAPAAEAHDDQGPSDDAAAGTAADCPKLYNGITVDETVELIRDAGYKARIEKEEDGTRYIESKASGRIFDVYFYNCDEETERCLQLMFQIRLKTTEEQQQKALEYDIKKVFGRAYNEGETTYMDYALHINGGVTGDYVKNNLELWDNVVGEFVQFIGW
jgi:hypothetical protein